MSKNNIAQISNTNSYDMNLKGSISIGEKRYNTPCTISSHSDRAGYGFEVNGNKNVAARNSSQCEGDNHSRSFDEVLQEPLAFSEITENFECALQSFHSKDDTSEGHSSIHSEEYANEKVSHGLLPTNESQAVAKENRTSKLIPGLISKPPLPKKTEPSHSFPEKEMSKSDDVMTAICTFLSLKYPTEEGNFLKNNRIGQKCSENLSINEKYNMEDWSTNKLQNIEYNTPTREYEEHSTMIQFEAQKSWAEEDVIDKESQTDKYLNKLKREHGILGTNSTDSFKLVKNNLNTMADISVVDLDDFSRHSCLELDNFSENKKEVVCRPQNENSLSIHQMQPESQSILIKSRRGVEERNNERKTNGLSRTKIRDRSNKRSNYSDILSKLDIDHPVLEKENLNDQNHIDSDEDDIVSILEALEEEDKKSHLSMSSVRKMVDMSLNPPICINNIDEATDSSGNMELSSRINMNRNTSNNNDSRVSSEYSVLISFLDEVDKNCSKSLESAKGNAQLVKKIVQSSIITDSVPKIENLKMMSTEELSQQVIDMSLRVKDKNASISLLQQELSNLRDQALMQNKRTEQAVKDSLKQQKIEFEGTIKRHQKFIDQLINDKKLLNNQCEGLIQEMRILEDRYQTNTRALEHKHQVDIKRLKEMQIASEKVKREKWIDNKTRKIKEITVKSIEPEIHHMEERHQQELANIRSLHKKEIEDLELKGARKMQAQCEALRDQLVQEREKAVAQERELLRKRYEKMVESEEKEYQEQKRRLQVDQANRLKEFEEREIAAQVEKDKAIKQVRDEFEDKLQAMRKKQTNEIKLLKESTQIQFETWRNDFKKQQMAELLDKEKNLREQCRKERDKEIESVIDRLESEASDNKMQIEQSAEARIRRIEEKYEKEIKYLEASEKDSKSKYYEAKTKLLNHEETIIELKANVRQMENQIQEYKETINAYEKEKCNLRETLKREMNLEIEVLEKELVQLKNSRDQELQQLHSRVKVSVAKKDEILNELQVEHKALQEKCLYLENMLEQQRKEYLLK